MVTDLDKYINSRYANWLEYSDYQCSKNNIADQSGDVLNYVLETLLTKNRVKAEELFSKKISQKKRCGTKVDISITELDAYILKAIQFSCIYKSSSYQLRNRCICRDANIDLCNVSIPVHETLGDKLEADRKCQVDHDKKIKIIENLLYRIGVNDREIRIFSFLLNGHEYREWEGMESKGKFHYVCAKVKKLLISELQKNQFKFSVALLIAELCIFI